MKKTIGIIVTVILILIIFFLGFIIFGNINNKWYKVMVVTSGSMSPVFETGDLIVIVKVTPEEINKEDIITFSMNGSLITHRVINIENGKFITKGDANEVVDDWKKNEVVPGGKYLFRIPKIGHLFSFLHKSESSLVDVQKISIDMVAPAVSGSAIEFEPEPTITIETEILNPEIKN